MLLSSGSQTKIAADTAMAMAAKANNGPARPSGANTNSGASRRADDGAEAERRRQRRQRRDPAAAAGPGGEIGLGRRRGRRAERAVDRPEQAEQDEGQRPAQRRREARGRGRSRTARSRRRTRRARPGSAPCARGGRSFPPSKARAAPTGSPTRCKRWRPRNRRSRSRGRSPASPIAARCCPTRRPASPRRAAGSACELSAVAPTLPCSASPGISRA